MAGLLEGKVAIITGAGNGADPQTNRRMPAPIVRATSGGSWSRRWYIVGTPKKTVGRCAWNHPATCSAWNRSARIIRHPLASHETTPLARPWTWKSGSVAR